MEAVIFAFFLVTEPRNYPLRDVEDIEFESSFSFVGAVVEVATSRVTAAAVALSPRWLLTSAHLLPNDRNGIDVRKYTILVGRPFGRYVIQFAITHPSYTWGLYTAEDLLLLRSATPMLVQPVHLPQGRFPWNSVPCQFIHWRDNVSNPKLSLGNFRVETTVVQNCLARKRRLPVGIVEFYANDLLCGTSESIPRCLGESGGLVLCGNLLVGLLLRRNWCENKTANFTDVGRFTNWLRSRVPEARFVHLTATMSAARATANALPVASLLSLFLLRREAGIA